MVGLKSRILLSILIGAAVCVFLIAPPHIAMAVSDDAEKTLSTEASALKQAFADLELNPDDLAVQERYLSLFPKDFPSFARLFAPRDFSELYDGQDYIAALGSLSPRYSEAVGEQLIRLSKDAPSGCCDALSHLRNAMANYAVNDTKIFVQLLKRCGRNNVVSIIRYLADVENHSAYEEYPLIISKLRKLGEEDLAKQFEQARVARIKRSTH
jgi:hypothetical protein